MDIVINNCFGGFTISDECVKLYAKKKGITLYEEKTEFSFTNYWTVPPENEQRIKAQQIQENFHQHSMEDQKWSNEFCTSNQIDNQHIDRDDPILVECVKELGSKADGEHACLKVVTIPDDVDWTIEEYDGMEWVAETHRTWS